MNNLVIVNGQINTMNPLSPYAEAMLIEQGVIKSIGSNKDVLSEMPFDAEVIDAKGNSVFPGFYDLHTHFMMTGQNLSAVSLKHIQSQNELISVLKVREKNMGPKTWLQGVGYDESQFMEKKLPRLEELDQEFPHRPIYLERQDAHQCCINTIAFHLLGLSTELRGVETDEQGRFTGILKDPAVGIARNLLADELITSEMREAYLSLAAKEALQKGVTTVCAMEGGEICNEKDVPVFLNCQEKLPLHTILMHQTMDVEKVIAEGQKTIGGCIILDGSIGSRTAAFFEDYADQPGCKGELYYSPKDVEDFVMEAHSKGLQIGMHCIGDKAIEQLLSSYEKALERFPRMDHRHRFEHFSVPTYEQILRTKTIGGYLSVQPSYISPQTAIDMYQTRLGEERIKRNSLLRTYLQLGIPLGGGSDAPVTPFDPFGGIAAAMFHFHAGERLSFYEGVNLFTRDAARFVFEEEERGTLEPGKVGDVVIVDRNVWMMNLTQKEEIQRIQVLYTIVSGKIQYKK